MRRLKLVQGCLHPVDLIATERACNAAAIFASAGLCKGLAINVHTATTVTDHDIGVANFHPAVLPPRAKALWCRLLMARCFGHFSRFVIPD